MSCQSRGDNAWLPSSCWNGVSSHIPLRTQWHGTAEVWSRAENCFSFNTEKWNFIGTELEQGSVFLNELVFKIFFFFFLNSCHNCSHISFLAFGSNLKLNYNFIVLGEKWYSKWKPTSIVSGQCFLLRFWLGVLVCLRFCLLVVIRN